MFRKALIEGKWIHQHKEIGRGLWKTTEFWPEYLILISEPEDNHKSAHYIYYV